MSWPTVLRIPCPRGAGDDSRSTPRLYPAWFWLYRTTRILRHRLNLHDWDYPPVYRGGSRCTWCGRSRQLSDTPTDRGDGTVVVIALVAALWTLGLPLAWMIHVWLSR